MPLIYYVLISISSATGVVTISPPFQSEYACEDTKKVILAGVEQLKGHGMTVSPVAVACKRVSSREEKPA